MAWWEILILLFLAGGAAALSKCLYSGGITHCTGLKLFQTFQLR